MKPGIIFHYLINDYVIFKNKLCIVERTLTDEECKLIGCPKEWAAYAIRDIEDNTVYLVEDSELSDY